MSLHFRTEEYDAADVFRRAPALFLSWCLSLPCTRTCGMIVSSEYIPVLKASSRGLEQCRSSRELSQRAMLRRLGCHLCTDALASTLPSVD